MVIFEDELNGKKFQSTPDVSVRHSLSVVEFYVCIQKKTYVLLFCYANSKFFECHKTHVYSIFPVKFLKIIKRLCLISNDYVSVAQLAWSIPIRWPGFINISGGEISLHAQCFRNAKVDNGVSKTKSSSYNSIEISVFFKYTWIDLNQYEIWNCANYWKSYAFPAVFLFGNRSVAPLKSFEEIIYDKFFGRHQQVLIVAKSQLTLLKISLP